MLPGLLFSSPNSFKSFALLFHLMENLNEFKIICYNDFKIIAENRQSKIDELSAVLQSKEKKLWAHLSGHNEVSLDRLWLLHV